VIERRIRTDRERFAELLAERAPCKILLEASTESEWVAQCLEELGHQVVVADPNFSPMYANRSQRIKTDKRDARTLAEACRLGAYRAAHRLSAPRRALRTQLAVRDALVRTRTRYISLIRAQLRGAGLRIASGSASSFVRRVDALGISESLRANLSALLALLETLNTEICRADEAMEQQRCQDPEIERLCTMPSVGPVTAAAFVSVVDQAGRFRGPHQAQAYLGLVPSEMSSGEQQRRGRITKAGNARVRSLLVQAAQSTMRLRYAGTARLWLWAEGIAKRRGKKIAVVALARRIAGVLYAMMRDQTRYQAVMPTASAA
jgi:transposase